MTATTVTYHPIGHIENEFDQPASPERIREVESRIILNPDLVEGLSGLEPGGQVMVVFDFHHSQIPKLQHKRMK